MLAGFEQAYMHSSSTNSSTQVVAIFMTMLRLTSRQSTLTRPFFRVVKGPLRHRKDVQRISYGPEPVKGE